MILYSIQVFDIRRDLMYNDCTEENETEETQMDNREFLDHMNSGMEVTGGSELHMYMSALSQEAIKITTEINSRYHTPEELRELFSELTGRDVDESFRMFPPFTTDCGKNIILGKNVFINSGCRFQDQGGITIGDGVLIGHNVVIATLNHNLQPKKRANLIPMSVKIGNCVWIGSNATILPGITIGDNAVIGAGSVVTKDVPKNTVVAGNPAMVIQMIEEE